jgi:predicted nuclease with TOPRIM domain
MINLLELLLDLINKNMGEKYQPNNEETEIKKISNLFDKAYETFNNNAPDFSKIEECLGDIKDELRAYNDDFTVILHEKEEHGGGIEENRNRIENMKIALSSLKEKIGNAEFIIKSNELLYGPFKKQIDSTKKIISILEKI